MRSFQSLRQFYRISGIFPPSQLNQKCLLNANNLFYVISMLQYMISTVSCSLFKTGSMAEYVKSFFGAISALIFIQIFLITISKSADIFMLIDKFDKFVEKSKFFSFLIKKKTFALFILRFIFRKKKHRTIEFRIPKCYLQWIKWKNRKNLSFYLYYTNEIDNTWTFVALVCPHLSQLFDVRFGRWIVKRGRDQCTWK